LFFFDENGKENSTDFDVIKQPIKNYVCVRSYNLNNNIITEDKRYINFVPMRIILTDYLIFE